MRDLILEGFIPLLGMTLTFALVFGIAGIVAKSRRHRLELQAQIQSKLIEKFGTTQELMNFLQSPVGKEFMTGVQEGHKTLVKDRVVSGLRRAIVVSFLGLGFVALWLITDLQGLAWPGVLLLVLGLGFLGASLTTMKFAQREEQSLTPAVPPASSDVR